MMTDINEKKQLSDKQKKIAALAGSVTKIDALDFKHLRKHGMKSAKKVAKKTAGIYEAKSATHSIYNVSAFVHRDDTPSSKIHTTHRVTVRRGDDEEKRARAVVAKHYGDTKHEITAVVKGQFNRQKSDRNDGLKEAIGAKDKQDEGEYGYEGDMAMSQLRTIIRNSEEMMKVLDKKTDLPEWVQSKITLATDYLQTANDYLMSELEEEVELDEASKVYDPITKKMVARKPIKVQAGGGVTRNGVPVVTGPSKHKEKMKVAEEVEQVDELSKGTLGRYIKAANSTDRGSTRSAYEAGKTYGKDGNSKYNRTVTARANKRMKGINKATDKLMANEDVEQVDELSQLKLANYVAKAATSLHNNAKEAGQYDDKENANKAFKRWLGIKSAAVRLRGRGELPGKESAIGAYPSMKYKTEEVERVDEWVPVVAGAASIAARAVPLIARAGGALGSKLGTRAGVALASRTGTSAMTAGRIGKQLGSAAGSALARTAATSVAQKLAAARERQQQQQQQTDEDVSISADRKDDKIRGKYLGMKKGKTMTGERANPVNMNPEIRMPEQGRRTEDK